MFLRWACPTAAVALVLMVAAAVLPGGRPASVEAGGSEVELPDAYFNNTHAIVEGECLSGRSFWDPAARIILTEYAFRADRVFLGDVGDVVRIVQPGGVLPDRDLGLAVSGSPSYTPGERTILFLWKSPRGEFRVNVNGWTTGSLPVRASGGRARGLAGSRPYEEVVAAIEARVHRMASGGAGGAR
ncbi:MAG: hypothetical protein JXP34_18085 [Planctomycetes bacterium]|nr:hypothetical protein [Planctomycetota bacterium]